MTLLFLFRGGHERIINSGKETDDIKNGLMLIYYHYEDKTKFMVFQNKTEHKWNLN